MTACETGGFWAGGTARRKVLSRSGEEQSGWLGWLNTLQRVRGRVYRNVGQGQI